MALDACGCVVARVTTRSMATWLLETDHRNQ